MDTSEIALAFGDLDLPLLSDRTLTASYRAITSLEVDAAWRVVGYLALPNGETLEQGTENLLGATRDP
jgi:hypothetical protein